MRHSILALLVTVLSVILLAIGAQQTAAVSFFTDPNYVSRFTQFAYGLNLPAAVIAAAISKTVWRGFSVRGVFVDARDLLTAVLGFLWWYSLSRFLWVQLRGSSHLNFITRICLAAVFATLFVLGLMLSRFASILGLSASAWSMVGLLWLYRADFLRWMSQHRTGAAS
jgi:hypothetical protein